MEYARQEQQQRHNQTHQERGHQDEKPSHPQGQRETSQQPEPPIQRPYSHGMTYYDVPSERDNPRGRHQVFYDVPSREEKPDDRSPNFFGFYIAHLFPFLACSWAFVWIWVSLLVYSFQNTTDSLSRLRLSSRSSSIQTFASPAQIDQLLSKLRENER